MTATKKKTTKTKKTTKKKITYLLVHPQKIKNLMKAVKEGQKYKVCCKCAGISTTAFYSWKKIGKRDVEDEKETPYSKFYTELMEANAQAEREIFNDVKKAGKNEWRASAWILEKRFGYGKDETVKGVEDDGKTKDEVLTEILALQKIMEANKKKKS